MGLLRRCVTSSGQVPQNGQEVARNFISRMLQIPAMPRYNMDEVPVYFDLPSSLTVDMRGLHTISQNHWS